MNPQQAQIAQAYQQQLGNMNPRGSALAQSVSQAQAYAPIVQQYQQQQNQINDQYNTVRNSNQFVNNPVVHQVPGLLNQAMHNPQQAASFVAGGAAQGLGQAIQNPQVQRGLFQIGQFLHQIGHPIAQQFNQMHGFNFGQQQKQNIPQQQPR